MPDPGIHAPGPPSPRPTRRGGTHRLIVWLATALALAAGTDVAAAGSRPAHEAVSPPGHHLQPTPTATPSPADGRHTFTSETGRVVSVSENAITISGESGTHTYRVNGSTRVCAGVEGLRGIRAGDQAWVIATQDRNGQTAVMVVDLTRPKWPAGHPAGSPRPGTPGPTEITPAPEPEQS